MLLVLLVAGIFVAIVFGKAGVDLMKGCIVLVFGAILMLVGCAIV